MEQKSIRVKTAIIGAGMSGIAAAINLLDNKYEDFLVFEAIEYIGGRCCTVKNDNGYIDMGAQWIHGQVNNPLFDLALENKLVLEGNEQIQLDEKEEESGETTESFIHLEGITKESLLQEFRIDKEEDPVVYATQMGLKLPVEFAQGIDDMLGKLVLDISKEKFETTEIDNRFGDYLLDKFNEAVDKELENLFDESLALSLIGKSKLTELIRGLFLMRCKRENIYSGTDNLFDLSLKNFPLYKRFEGNDSVELTNGAESITDAIISKHKDEFYQRLRLNCQLKKIYLSSKLKDKQPVNIYDRKCKHSEYTDDINKAVLVFCDRTDPNKPEDVVVICDNVICTMSLGYLKENVNHFIEPISFISNEKRLAISRLGFGTVNKIFLYYDNEFWDENLKWIGLVWLPTESVNDFRIEKLNHQDDVSDNWVEQIVGFMVVRSQKNCLSAWISGCEYFEKIDDKTIMQECTKLLRKFLGSQSIPEPKSIQRTKWKSNKFVRGSYTCMPIGSMPSDFDALASPIPSKEKPIIRFAGEATHADYFSTMHGAYLTGLRESNSLLEQHQQQQQQQQQHQEQDQKQQKEE